MSDLPDSDLYRRIWEPGGIYDQVREREREREAAHQEEPAPAPAPTVYADPATGRPAGVVVGGHALPRAAVEAAYIALTNADVDQAGVAELADNQAKVLAFIPGLANLLALLLLKPDGSLYNHIAWDLGSADPTIGALELILQRVNGVTPTQRAQAAEARAACAEAALDQQAAMLRRRTDQLVRWQARAMALHAALEAVAPAHPALHDGPQVAALGQALAQLQALGPLLAEAPLGPFEFDIVDMPDPEYPRKAVYLQSAEPHGRFIAEYEWYVEREPEEIDLNVAADDGADAAYMVPALRYLAGADALARGLVAALEVEVHND